jgi:hypothetical protein
MLTGTDKQYTIHKRSQEVNTFMAMRKVGTISSSVGLFLQFGIYAVSVLDVSQVTACETDIQGFNMRQWHTHFLLLLCLDSNT